MSFYLSGNHLQAIRCLNIQMCPCFLSICYTLLQPYSSKSWPKPAINMSERLRRTSNGANGNVCDKEAFQRVLWAISRRPPVSLRPFLVRSVASFYVYCGDKSLLTVSPSWSSAYRKTRPAEEQRPLPPVSGTQWHADVVGEATWSSWFKPIWYLRVHAIKLAAPKRFRFLFRTRVDLVGGEWTVQIWRIPRGSAGTHHLVVPI